ncbi:hypothetical protein GLAREA_13033 [Glarea lozoyensis ATCC 20868]|uniref:4-coumarate:coenzyme A ligase n=2 Tax=Glarea lozoyensis TaxID=101852 RepID=S3CXJ9_GLAL2|nr:uncharacterized protein GLAREA_13033 [Glarea lozoyensis ATCC 20868]EHK96115.1 hypothetical protein M7I_8201 [Glarea lozoyensis 74030]EPE30310.1 hypothetical protein GLAREA_13033 [Glarea lozoyensis ATCC 20868]
MVPAPRTFSRSTGLLVSGAGVASAAPLLFFIPGFEERLAAQAAKWGPRWNRGFAKRARLEHHYSTKVEPRLEKGVAKVEPPLKKAALMVDRNMKKMFERFPQVKK